MCIVRHVSYFLSELLSVTRTSALLYFDSPSSGSKLHTAKGMKTRQTGSHPQSSQLSGSMRRWGTWTLGYSTLRASLGSCIPDGLQACFYIKMCGNLFFKKMISALAQPTAIAKLSMV